MRKQDAIDHFGSRRKLAAALGITPPAITQWGRDVPPLRAFELELLTKGKLKRKP